MTLKFKHLKITHAPKKFGQCLLFIGFCVLTQCAVAQMIVAEGFSANVLVNNVLVGDGVETRNISYTGYDRSFALFENGLKADLGLDKGIILSSGVAVGVRGPNNNGGYTSGLGGPGNAILEKIAGTKTLDAAVLQFDFKPQTNHIEFKYIFASDEYKEWVDAGFNDIFGFFISGPGITGEMNVALVPGKGIPVSIDNVNHKRNTGYYVDNVDVTSKVYAYLQPDGLTTVLTSELELVPCEWYTIKLAIADVGDQIKDSWVFVESKSFKHKTSLGRDTIFCSDKFVHTLDAGNPGRPVLWSTGEKTQKINVTSFGTYWVEVFTACGSFIDQINILPSISPIFIGNDTFACENEIDLTLQVKNRVFEKYLWSTGDTTAIIRVTKPGTYWLKVMNNGCSRYDTITIGNKVVPKFDFGKDTVICAPANILLNPAVSGDVFTWSNGSSDSYLAVSEKGKYWLRITKDGCSFSDTIIIERRTDFTFDIGPQTIELCETKDILLNTKIKDSLNYSILWSTGDTTPFIWVKESGNYSVSVTDRYCNFNANDAVDIFMLATAQNFFVPNAFTPNADNLNDSIKPVFGFSDIESYLFVVFNKWGQKVFESHTPGEAWDGQFNNKMAKAEVYIWYCSIKTSCLPDPLQHQHGTITLMR